MCYTIGGKGYAAGAVRNGYDSKADEMKFYLAGWMPDAAGYSHGVLTDHKRIRYGRRGSICRKV